MIAFSAPLSANNTWTLTGDLNNPRIHHSSTVLNSQQVLVAGGDMDSVLLDSAELFDPSTSQWTLTTSMHQKRQKHVAVLLDDGRVLVAGGSGVSTDLASAEVLNPLTSTWSVVASMSSPRVGALVTKLQDGRVLVSSGTANGVGLNSAEIYDPASNTWASTGAMVEDATHADGALLLQDGRVFIIGLEGWQNALPPSSFDPPNTPTRLPQLYDPLSNSWAAASARGTQQRGGTNVVLSDGTVLSTGGSRFQTYDFGYPVFTCDVPTEIYQPDTNSWSLSGAMLTPKGASHSALLPDGKVLAFGGCDAGGHLAHLYDAVTGTWSSTDWLSFRHDGGGVSMLADGKVLFSGGHVMKNIVEAYTPTGPSPFSPPRSQSMHVADLDGESVENADGSWTAFMTVTVLDENDRPVYRADVDINADTCDTNDKGQCTVESTTTTDFRSFNVRDIAMPLLYTNSLPAIAYNASANTDPDGDSDGTTIIVQRGGGSTPPPPVTESVHVADLDDSSVVNGNLWTPTVTVTARDNLGNLASGAVVHGTWGNGLSGSFLCFADASATCSGTYSAAIDIGTAPTGSLTITDVSWSIHPYASSDNTDPDGDSNGTVIMLNAPDVPPGPTGASMMFVSDLEGFGKKKGRRRWQANVDITVRDDNGEPVANATVTGDWGSSGASGSDSCTTDDNGTCRVKSDRIKNIYTVVTFSVRNLTHSTLSYEASLNGDADGDSGGTTYWVNKP